jgi:hypothetical protein
VLHALGDDAEDAGDGEKEQHERNDQLRNQGKDFFTDWPLRETR